MSHLSTRGLLVGIPLKQPQPLLLSRSLRIAVQEKLIGAIEGLRQHYKDIGKSMEGKDKTDQA